MATNYAYPNHGGGSVGLGLIPPSRSPSRSPTLPSRLLNNLPAPIRTGAAELESRVVSMWSSSSSRRIGGIGDLSRGGLRTIRRIFRIPNLLVVLWLFTLWWGERLVFRQSIESCEWGDWEKWVLAPWSTARFLREIANSVFTFLYSLKKRLRTM
jgi:hypothetical protein